MSRLKPPDSTECPRSLDLREPKFLVANIALVDPRKKSGSEARSPERLRHASQIDHFRRDGARPLRYGVRDRRSPRRVRWRGLSWWVRRVPRWGRLPRWFWWLPRWFWGLPGRFRRVPRRKIRRLPQRKIRPGFRCV